MRDIKLRAWHISSKKYVRQLQYKYTGDEEYSDEGTLAIDIDGDLCYDDYGNGMYKVEVPQAYIIEQYTGLEDKQGKEIYEGDIVSLKTTRNDPYGYQDGEEVEYTGVVKTIDCLTAAYWGFNDCNNIKITSNLEVIGNIHENPELLE
jgi:uncharacterized phage protein (TIGR01671 family)